MQYRKLNAVILLMCILLSGCGQSQSSRVAETGFDKICRIYTNVFTAKKFANLPQAQKLKIIDERIHKRLRSMAAIKAYVYIAEIDPRHKYRIFRDVAEYTTRQPWACPVLKKLSRQNFQKHSSPLKQTVALQDGH